MQPFLLNLGALADEQLTVHFSELFTDFTETFFEDFFTFLHLLFLILSELVQFVDLFANGDEICSLNFADSFLNSAVLALEVLNEVLLEPALSTTVEHESILIG